MPITEANLQPDLRLAVALDTALRIILSDTASIRTTGAVDWLGTVDGTGSATSRIRYAGLGATDTFAQPADGAAQAETALTDASADIAVVRGALVRELTDLANLTGFAQDINPATLAASMAASYERYFDELVCAAMTTLTTDVTVAGAMDTDTFFDAIQVLEIADVPGPYYAILAPIQISELQNDLRAAAGSIAFMPATAELLAIKGQGYAGQWLGVDLFKSSYVETNGADRNGAMFGQGCFGYKTGTIRPPIGTVVTSPNSEIVVEFQRQAASGLTQIVGHAYLGVGLLETARGVGINSDA